MRLIPLVFLVGCGGIAAEAPLTVSLGLTHDGTEAALKKHQFCLETSSGTVKHMQQKQTYPRCERPAAEHGQAWVIARYEGDKLVELRRFERYGEQFDSETGAGGVEIWLPIRPARAAAVKPA